MKIWYHVQNSLLFISAWCKLNEINENSSYNVHLTTYLRFSAPVLLAEAIFTFSGRIPSGCTEVGQFPSGPGHEAFKANWLMARSGAVTLPSLWTGASGAQPVDTSSLERHSAVLEADEFHKQKPPPSSLFTRRCLMSTTSLLGPLEKMKDAETAVNILLVQRMLVL